MKEASLKILSSEYPNWNFNLNPNDKVKLLIDSKFKLEADLIEMLAIIKKISAFFYDTSNVIRIEKNGGYRIEVMVEKKASKYKKMYTSGCFDIFHYGHLNILKKSKELCDHLVVGVSTDELIKKEKGRLPVIPFYERMNVVKAISYVDEVIPQVDKNKQRVVDEHQIDAISVGDDWKGRFPKTTCPIEYFAYTANVSSTILKNTLQLQDNKS
ncbi:adenylyltransferase/cytidyltransferase family protein [Cellulophaga sp. F20128]|uniref:adenylyltransferase/cytidyltransferase family protein n=1 Tax=Cellulophaga sp. F20128 TaxID=2926413 RepID=UPI001FF4AFDF|nr:adenylyltransferase/cytidyltransferase family protein [Cellulophaga sp. F20128]MCK0158740.1 adenylyltransferase/cytidyltransferase family protein [Cellulophaga sp. F20128]|tara:strand:- start:2235 stop:2873 length:639 start_codon:yes stop_codon:yes gene_type:complete